MIPLSPARAAAFRLERQFLASQASAGAVVQAVRTVCGVQAQIPSAAELAIWARVRDVRRTDIAELLWQKRQLVRTWCMRGTIHLLPTADVPVYVSALMESGLRREQAYLARRGVAARDVERATESIAANVGPEPITRAELAGRVSARIGARFRKWIEHGGGDILRPACLKGLICFGPSRGAEATFVSLPRWAPGPKRVPSEEAEETLLLRHLRAYGPSTDRDFSWWSGIAAGAVARIRQRLGRKIAAVEVDGRAAWLLAEDLDVVGRARARRDTVNLLPSLDVYMLGHRDKTAVVDEAHYKRVFQSAGRIAPVVLVNGRAAGVWSREERSSRIVITVTCFAPLSRAIKARVQDLATGMGLFGGATGEARFA